MCFINLFVYAGIAEKGATKQDVYCLLLVSQCLLQMMDHDGVIKKVLGSTGFLFELLLQLKVLELSFALPEVLPSLLKRFLSEVKQMYDWMDVLSLAKPCHWLTKYTQTRSVQ